MMPLIKIDALPLIHIFLNSSAIVYKNHQRLDLQLDQKQIKIYPYYNKTQIRLVKITRNKHEQK